MKYTPGGIVGSSGQPLRVEVASTSQYAPKPDPADPVKDEPFVEGIDVSSAQNPASIKWKEVRASGRRFVYAQMGMTPEALKQGMADEDKAGRRHIEGAHAAGLWVGAYQFAYFNHDAQRDAELFLKSIEQLPLSLPPMIDAEQPKQYWKKSAAQVVEWIRTWVRVVEGATGRKPVIYSGHWWEQLQDVGGRDPEWASYTFFVANYNQIPSPPVPKPWTRWDFWQYRGNTIWQKGKEQVWGAKCPGAGWSKVGLPGTCPGCPGELDVDKYNGNLAAFEAWARGGAAAPQKPKEPVPHNLSDGPAGGGGEKPAPKPPEKPSEPVTPVTPSQSTRPGFPLLPEDLKAKYLRMSFKVGDEQIDLSLPHLKYHNVDKVKSSVRDELCAVVQGLVREQQKKDQAVLDDLIGKKLAFGVPVFARYAFNGKGSPEQIEAVLKLAGFFGKKRLGKDWRERPTLSESLQAFYFDHMGLDCSGFAGNYARAIGCTDIGPDQAIPSFVKPHKKRKSVDEFLPGDLMVWTNGAHVATIQGRRPDGLFEIVESNGDQIIFGLGNTQREITQAGPDTFKLKRLLKGTLHAEQTPVYVITPK